MTFFGPSLCRAESIATIKFMGDTVLFYIAGMLANDGTPGVQFALTHSHIQLEYPISPILAGYDPIVQIVIYH